MRLVYHALVQVRPLPCSLARSPLCTSKLSEAIGQQLLRLLARGFWQGSGQGGAVQVDGFAQFAGVLVAGGGTEAMDCGFVVAVEKDLDRLVWRKLAVNCAINPLSALAGRLNGELLESAESRETLVKAATEVAAVAAAKGLELGADVGALVLAVARETGANRSSMLQDVLRGAPTEVEAICGAVARIARDLGIYTPINVRLCRLVRQVEAGNPPLLEPGDVAGLLELLDLESIKYPDESYN